MWEIIRASRVSSGTPSAGRQDSDRLQPRLGGPLGPEFPSRRPAVPRKAGTPFRREKKVFNHWLDFTLTFFWWLCMWTRSAAAGEPGLGAFWKLICQFPQRWGLFGVGRYKRKHLQPPAGVLYYSLRWETHRERSKMSINNHVSILLRLFCLRNSSECKSWSSQYCRLLLFCTVGPHKPQGCVQPAHIFGILTQDCW